MFKVIRAFRNSELQMTDSGFSAALMVNHLGLTRVSGSRKGRTLARPLLAAPALAVRLPIGQIQGWILIGLKLHNYPAFTCEWFRTSNLNQPALDRH